MKSSPRPIDPQTRQTIVQRAVTGVGLITLTVLVVQVTAWSFGRPPGFEALQVILFGGVGVLSLLILLSALRLYAAARSQRDVPSSETGDGKPTDPATKTARILPFDRSRQQPRTDDTPEN